MGKKGGEDDDEDDDAHHWTKMSSSDIGLAFHSGDVDPETKTKVIVGLVLNFMAVCLFGGLGLIGFGSYYMSEIAGAGMGEGFFYCGGVLAFVGLAGILGAKGRQLWLMMVAEISLILIFVLLYFFTIIAVLLATETHNPVGDAVDTAWKGGLRHEILEYEVDRYCKKHTGNLGACFAFYKDVDIALKRQGTTCPHSITTMALDCEKGVGDPCFVSRIECQACDELCRRTYKQHIMDKIEPAAIVAYFVLAFCVIAGATMTYLISTPRVGLAAKFGLIINACVALCSFIGIFFFVYTINTAGEGCPPGQSCAGGTLYVCLFLCVVIMVVSAGAAYSINKSNRGFMRIANALYIALSFIMMMAAILLSVASGAISDIDTYVLTTYC